MEFDTGTTGELTAVKIALDVLGSGTSDKYFPPRVGWAGIQQVLFNALTRSPPPPGFLTPDNRHTALPSVTDGVDVANMYHCHHYGCFVKEDGQLYRVQAPWLKWP